MIFSLNTELRSGDTHVMPHLTRDQLLTILWETAPDGGLRDMVKPWIDSDEPQFTDIDFDGRPFNIVRL